MKKDLVTGNKQECGWCGDEIPRGSDAYWDDNNKPVCEYCGDKYLAECDTTNAS